MESHENARIHDLPQTRFGVTIELFVIADQLLTLINAKFKHGFK